MNLLAMASEGNVPAADDFVPVLVYVLIAVSILLGGKETYRVRISNFTSHLFRFLCFPYAG